MRPNWIILAAAVLAAGVAAAQPKPGGPSGGKPGDAAPPAPTAPVAPPAQAAPATPPAPPPSPGARGTPGAGDALTALDREIDGTCFQQLDAQRLAQRLEPLRPADPAELYRRAPAAMLALARLERLRDDFAAATRDYDGLIAALPAGDGRRDDLARERAALADEQALVGGGGARPVAGAALQAMRDAPGPDGATWRVGLWVKPNCTPFGIGDGQGLLALYRLTGATPALAQVGEPVRAAADMSFIFTDDASWGSDITGDGRRALPIFEANGGNCWACTRLRVYVASAAGLSELRVDAPDFVVPSSIETVGGRRMLSAIDIRWETFGEVCHACAPGVAVLFAWRNDRFTPVCREQPDYYRERIRVSADGLADRDPGYRFGAITSRLLARAQIGEADKAWPEYRAALAALRRLRGVARNAFQRPEAQLEAAFRAARPAMATAACPVSALPLRRG